MPEIYNLEGFFVTTLSSAINSSTTTIPLTAVPAAVTKGYLIIEPNSSTKREVIHFTSVGATTVTAADDTTDGSDATGRGCSGSITVGANTTHDQGVTVLVGAIEQYWARIIDSLENLLTLSTGAVDGTKVMKITSTDGQLATGGNIQVNSADPWRTISLPAPTWSPTTTSGCGALATVEAGTNDIDYRVLPFDASSDERAFCNFQMPESWDAGVVQYRYVWTNAGGGAGETVVLELSGRSYADDDAIDQAVGTAIEVSDTWIAQNDIHISAWSGDVTITGAAASEWVHLELMRDVSEDNLTGDARLINVQIRYKQAQYSD